MSRPDWPPPRRKTDPTVDEERATDRRRRDLFWAGVGTLDHRIAAVDRYDAEHDGHRENVYGTEEDRAAAVEAGWAALPWEPIEG